MDDIKRNLYFILAICMSLCFGEKLSGKVTQDKNKIFFSFYATESGPEIVFMGGKYRSQHEVPKIVIKGKNSEEARLLLYLQDWTCGACRKMHQELLSLAADNSFDKSYSILVLPAYSDEEGRDLHEIMLTAYLGKPEVYEVLAQLLNEEVVAPKAKLVQEALFDLIHEKEWAKIKKTTATKVDYLLQLAMAQVSYNAKVAKLSTFPQFLSARGVFIKHDGADSVREFLEQSANEQVGQHGPTPPKFFVGATHRGHQVNAIPDRNESEISFESVLVRVDQPLVPGEIASGVFRFTNTGKAPLHIYGLRSNCDCTYGGGVEQVVAPGEQGQLTVFYNSKGRSPKGVENRLVWVSSSAKNFDTTTAFGEYYGNPIRLVIPMAEKRKELKKAQPKPQKPTRNSSKIEFDNKTVTSSAITIGEVASAIFRFTNTGTEPLEIYEVITDCSCTYTHDGQQLVQPGKSGQFTIFFNSRSRVTEWPAIQEIWVKSSARNFDQNNPAGEFFGNMIKMKVPLNSKASKR